MRLWTTQITIEVVLAADEKPSRGECIATSARRTTSWMRR